MKKNISGIAALIFVAIAGYFIYETRPPSQDALTQETARVLAVTKQKNWWYEASIQTQSGVVLTCRAKKNPNAWASRCPVIELEGLVGQPVTVWYNPDRLYVIEHAGVELMGMEQHQSAQYTAWGLAALVLVMALAALFLM
ncbi:MAG: hypothetical protein IPG80_09575 [Anaerolineales bacterium]|uniref:hypothetical protein n=1 Tax=Candidatus Villigracilis vicinus TaxID=3140679 RepID=UPI0031354B90|nr:hypothetical protein [Anaerolineales bacterium]